MGNASSVRQRSEIDFYTRRGDFEAVRWHDEDLKLHVGEIDNLADKWGFAYRLAGSGGWQGKRVLDLGCGSGIHACYFALKGADVSAVDIHPDAVALTLRRASVNGVADKVEACAAAAEDLPYPRDHFDLVFCGLVLHHLDIERAGSEIARVLTPGGKVVCLETSARNPLLMFARRFLTGRFGIKRFASPMERPLSAAEVSRFGAYFSAGGFRKGYDFLSLAGRMLPGKKGLHGVFRQLDPVLFRALPFVEKWGYHVILEFTKSEA